MLGSSNGKAEGEGGHKRLLVDVLIVGTLALIFAHSWWLFFEMLVTKLAQDNAENKDRGALFFGGMYLLAMSGLVLIIFSIVLYFDRK